MLQLNERIETNAVQADFEIYAKPQKTGYPAIIVHPRIVYPIIVYRCLTMNNQIGANDWHILY
ncbi:hypothetical protein IQ268_14140 [Oculatella sp. LEGE 06141]|uniref:hypothetical protein n=1 Tax=Oculatella sp. LEGE 06141 TaxID=1828648 RepID=UPI00187DE65B|nr:hypothetical protein [Oculatella sp. LEGE 06141]MBE9179705.1 hypothetical protein [Oculatella sp. LEGE 06141]